MLPFEYRRMDTMDVFILGRGGSLEDRERFILGARYRVERERERERARPVRDREAI